MNPLACCRMSRNCPECGATVTKENPEDHYICTKCGWSETKKEAL